MDHPLKHPSAAAVVERVVHTFSHDKWFASQDRHLIFVCGGPVGETQKSVRNDFLKYAEAELTSIRVFLAEYAAQDLFSYRRPHFINVAEFEELIADVSDCLLLFPEGPGSFAELGYFAAHERARKKTLVVNDTNFQDDSFLNIGPIALIDAQSEFRSTIRIDFSATPRDFTAIKKRLDRFPRQNRRRFHIQKYAELSGQERLYLVCELIAILGATEISALCELLNAVAPGVNAEEVSRLVSP